MTAPTAARGRPPHPVSPRADPLLHHIWAAAHQAGLTRQQFARHTHLSRSTVTSLLLGRRTGTIHTLRTLAAGAGLRIVLDPPLPAPTPPPAGVDPIFAALDAARRRRGWTAAGWAARAGVGRNAVLGRRAAQAAWSVDTARLLARSLGCRLAVAPVEDCRAGAGAR